MFSPKVIQHESIHLLLILLYYFYWYIFLFENISMSTMKHLLSQIFEGVHPLIPHLTLGPNNQGGWRHAAAVDWSDHAKYRTEDRVHHLEERAWTAQPEKYPLDWINVNHYGHKLPLWSIPRTCHRKDTLTDELIGRIRWLAEFCLKYSVKRRVFMFIYPIWCRICLFYGPSLRVQGLALPGQPFHLPCSDFRSNHSHSNPCPQPW